jgi:hypothetical protein
VAETNRFWVKGDCCTAISVVDGVSVQFIAALPTVDPCFRSWILRQSNRLVRNRHVIDEFVPPQRVSIVKHAVTSFPMRRRHDRGVEVV